MRHAIATESAPPAIGPYSQAVRAGQFLFLSGQIPLHPATGLLAGPDIHAQAHQVMHNLEAVLAAAGASFADVVRSTIYLTDLNDFAAVNDVYASYFELPAPARATVEVSRLPRDARVEIDAIALLPART
jgi:2-iminobutanoate/2-iminopropanoate deaminase